MFSNIRPMKKEDWAAFKPLDTQLFPDDPIDIEHFQRMLETKGVFALTTKHDKIIGYLYVNRFGDTHGHLGRIGVSQDFQNQGFGTKLMEYALRWFREQGGITIARLYTQDFNTTAQHLYEKFGFKVKGTTWHYFIPFTAISPQGKCTCHPVKDEEIDVLAKRYKDSMPAVQIHRWLENQLLVLTLKNPQGKIVGACRFSPSFPGCFPFEIDTILCFDDFIYELQKFSLTIYDYVRITFTDLPELVRLMEHRNYKLHHRLHKMELSIKKGT
jgi:ribosomal-protein-alanine N-acetyltransferase